MVFMWPFLPPLSPLTRQTGRVRFGVLPELITWAGAKTNHLKDNSATVESDFSILKWEKDLHRLNITPFSLEGILHYHQIHSLLKN
jgi:hypothetical protein